MSYKRGEAGEQNKPHPSLKKAAKDGPKDASYNRAKIGDKNKPAGKPKGSSRDIGSEYAEDNV